MKNLTSRFKFWLAVAATVLAGLAMAIDPAGAVQTSGPVTAARTSANWSGYAATGGTYTGVGSTWVVPQVSKSNYGADAAWVGIGGISGQDIIQAGTQGMIGRTGNIDYQAWIELLPRSAQPIPLSVNAGDSITVAITRQSGNIWNVSVKNNTSGQNYQTAVNYNSSLSSAEWIQEMPSSGRSFIPLDNFGTVQFTNGWAIQNGNQVTISQSGAKMINMINQAKQVLASTSSLATDGTDFSVTRSNVAAVSSVPNVTGYSGRGWGRTGSNGQTSTASPVPAISPVPSISVNVGGGWQIVIPNLNSWRRQVGYFSGRDILNNLI
ncbi:MAG: G1 family endopeptidase [Patescibacteria group bacterium]|nr:G1 family endopeptidase [Patescibacteria group bacterium]